MNEKAAKKQIYRTSLKYITFNVWSMIGLSCYILADTLFIANGLGSRGLTALNLVIPAFTVVSATGLLIGMGAATKYSNLMGQGDLKAANRIFTHALVLAGFFGILFVGAGAFYAGSLTALLRAEGEIYPMACGYLRIILLFSPAFLFNSLLVSFIRNDSNPGLAMTAMLCGSLSNIILDYVFIYPLHMGMKGAALATCLAPIISLCILSLHFIKKKNRFRPVKTPLRLVLLKEIVLLGASSFINEMASAVTILFFNIAILSQSGNMGVAAYGIVANLALIVNAVYTGIGQGIQPVVGTSFGKGRMKDAKRAFFLGAALALLLGILFYSLGLYGAKGLVALFNREKDPRLEQLAAEGIRIYFAAFLPAGINMASVSFLASVSSPGKAMLISITRGFAAIMLFLTVLPLFLGMDGIWMAVPCAELTALGIVVLCLLKKNNVRKLE